MQTSVQFNSIMLTCRDMQRTKKKRYACNYSLYQCSAIREVCRRRKNKTSWFFYLNVHSFHPLTSGVQIPAGGHLRRRPAEQHVPARPIPSQTKSGAPWSTHVERRSPTVLNLPTQTASSTLSETTSRRAPPGSDSGRPPVPLCLSG